MEPDRRLRLALAAGLLACWLPAGAQDATRGAALYMRTPDGGRSCLSCHGPDPAANPNNILRATDNPAALTQALSTVSRMGFLGSRLTLDDRADLSAFLGTVVAQSAAGVPHLWPQTVEFGTLQLGTLPAVQRVRLSNRQATPVVVNSVRAEGTGLSASHACPRELAAGAWCDITLRFAPAAPGWASAALRVDLEGRARPLVTGASAQATLEPASALEWVGGTAAPLAFEASQRAADGSVRRRVELHNPGPMPATLGQATLVGPQAAQFRVAQLCPGIAVLQAGTRCEVEVAFQPNLLPRAEALLQLETDQGHPTALRLEGDGLPPTAQEEQEAAVALPEGGGGCSVGPGTRPTDPTLAVLAALAALALARSRRRPRPGA